MPRPENIRRAVPLLLLLGAYSPATLADAGQALNYFFRQSSTHDDNLFRLPDGVAPVRSGAATRADTLNSTEVGAVFDWTYGIQRLKANLSATAQRYRNNTDLGNDRHDEGVAWFWRSGNRFDGELSWSRSAAQSSFADLRVAVANIVTTTTAVASGNFWFHSDWSAGIRGVGNALANSSSVQAGNDSESRVGELNLRYRPASGNSIGVRWVETSGRYPNPQITAAGPVDNGYRQREAGIEMAYRPSGASDLGASLGRVERHHRQLAARDFRGMTGRASWNWQATGQTRLAASGQREIGAQSETQASYTLTDTVSVGVDWTPTAKTSLSASLVETRRKFSGDPATALAGGAAQTDRTRLLGLTASYLPMTRLSLSLTLQDERRDASTADRDYRSRRALASVAYSF